MAAWLNGMLARCARWRVPVGFVVGLLGLGLAQPTWPSLRRGALVALFGAGLRVWAAGHLDKGREVTSSGPYRWVRHPLYLGSALMGIGFIIAANHAGAAALVLLYLLVTLTAAIRIEDAWLAARFGADYAAYRAGHLPRSSRRFTFARVRANREGRALAGFVAVLAVLAWKAAGGR